MSSTATDQESRGMDGTVSIQQEADGGLQLTVFPPSPGGKPAEFAAVRSEIEKFGVGGVNWASVDAAVAEASGQPVRILSPRSAQKGQLFVEIAPDEFSAKITIVPPDDGSKAALTADHVRTALATNGVVYGIKEDVLAQIDGQQEYAQPTELLVAEGVPVRNGEDAKLEWLIKLPTEGEEQEAEAKVVEEGEDGRVDYHFTAQIDNVKKGQVLCRKSAPGAGQDGKTVTGNDIPAQAGKDMPLKLGRGVEILESDPTAIVAATDGQVTFRDEKLQVLSIYEIAGDVDLTSGNIDFVGSVIIHGAVRDGFKVKAGEDVMVDGVVEGAEIQAGGKLFVKSGVQGSDKARLIADGDITAKYIYNAALVQTGKNVICHEAIMHSKVLAGEKVQVIGRKGLIVGGEIVCGGDVICKELGSKFATPTKVEVGAVPGTKEEMERVGKELQALEANLDKTKKGITFLKDLSDKTGGNLPSDKKELLTKLTRAQFKLMADLKNLQLQKEKLAADEKKAMVKRGKVAVMGVVNPGVKILCRRAQRQITDEQKFVTFTELNGEIKVGVYR